jgi:Astacin (Peptidase family M12A)
MSSGNNSTDGSSGETQSSGESKSGWIAGVSFESKRVTFSDVNGKAIFEGDIVLGTVEELQNSKETSPAGLGIHGRQYRWPNKTVPYTIEAGFSNPNRVTDAMKIWQDRLGFRFVKRTDETAYVVFTSHGTSDDNGCHSQIGRRGGQQETNLQPNACTTGNAIHEIGHVLGLWHEQSRHDRDQYIKINWQNIDPRARHNFDQQITDGDDIGPYDYGSIMHYNATAFSINGQPTIIRLKPGPERMGQRDGLSNGDIAAVKQMYQLGG